MSSKVAISRITSKGQVTIPEVIRRGSHLEMGDQIEWDVTESGTIEVKKVVGSLEALAKILPKSKRRLSIEEMNATVTAHLTKKHHVRR